MSKPQDSGGFEKNFSDFIQLCKKRPEPGHAAAQCALLLIINIKHTGHVRRCGAREEKLRKK